MRGAALWCALTCAAVPAMAQRFWNPEIGLQGGFAHVKPSGTGASDAINLIDAPGGSFVTAVLSYAPLYAIIPIGQRFAVEPQAGLAQATVSTANAVTFARLGARLDYAVTQSLYVAGGGVLNDVQTDAPRHLQVGLQAGLGYRTTLGSRLSGRLEVGWITTHGNHGSPPAVNAYTGLIGISSRLDSRGAERPAHPAPGGAWAPSIGFNAGYASIHAVGGETVTLLFFPGSGADPTSLGGIVPTVPTLFLQLPLGGKWALEPSVDAEYGKAPFTFSTTKVGIGGRVDYAVRGGWYAGLGGQLLYVRVRSSTVVPGVVGAWGYRFHILHALGGRFEASYLMSARQRDLNLPPVNSLSLLFGTTAELR